MKQMTEKQAIEMAKNNVCVDWTDEQIVRFQLFQDRLCMDFSLFHKAIQNVLCRPVYTHEFAHINLLIEEYLGAKNAPTFDEIIYLIPKEKQIIILQ